MFIFAGLIAQKNMVIYSMVGRRVSQQTNKPRLQRQAEPNRIKGNGIEVGNGKNQ